MTPLAPTRPRPIPTDATARNGALTDVGRRIYQALIDGELRQLLLDELALRDVLDPREATRVSALRVGIGQRIATRAGAFASLEEATFTGVCVQGARLEPARGRLGLKAPGWVFDRALVVGTKVGGRRTATWVEGSFLFTGTGFQAIDLLSVEEPRWEHSDLELAPCDMEVGVRAPLPVVEATP